MTTGPDIYRVPQLDHIEEETLPIFTSQTESSCFRDLLANKCFIGRAKDLVHSFCCWLGIKLSCLVMFVLLVCDLCKTTVRCDMFVLEFFERRALYSFCRLCIILKFSLLQVIGVPCIVLYILRRHSITGKDVEFD